MAFFPVKMNVFENIKTFNELRCNSQENVTFSFDFQRLPLICLLKMGCYFPEISKQLLHDVS